MNKCADFNNITQRFKDGRIICPATLPTDGNKCTNVYAHIKCTCDKYPQGCTSQLNVFTDAQEAIRDNFWTDRITGGSCQFANRPDIELKEITISVKKAN